MPDDIVCGRNLGDKKTDFRTRYEDRTYVFCSETCLREFVKNPFHYLDKSRSVSSTEGSPKLDEDGRKTRSNV